MKSFAILGLVFVAGACGGPPVVQDAWKDRIPVEGLVRAPEGVATERFEGAYAATPAGATPEEQSKAFATEFLEKLAGKGFKPLCDIGLDPTTKSRHMGLERAGLRYFLNINAPKDGEVAFLLLSERAGLPWDSWIGKCPVAECEGLELKTAACIDTMALKPEGRALAKSKFADGIPEAMRAAVREGTPLMKFCQEAFATAKKAFGPMCPDYRW